jgi:hypothetical protein
MVVVQADKENMDEIIRIVVKELGQLSVEDLHEACDDVYGQIAFICACVYVCLCVSVVGVGVYVCVCVGGCVCARARRVLA